jgi:hypothetical protein
MPQFTSEPCPPDVAKKASELIMDVSAAEVRRFLEQYLPKLSPDWWKLLVYSCLEPYEQRRVPPESPKLEFLDLSALIRVMNRHYHMLAREVRWTGEQKEYLLGVRNARNRWAHRGGTPPDCEDVYRDLDTLHRFLTAIEAKSDVLKRIVAVKQHVGVLAHGELRPEDRYQNTAGSGEQLFDVDELMKTVTPERILEERCEVYFRERRNPDRIAVYRAYYQRFGLRGGTLADLIQLFEQSNWDGPEEATRFWDELMKQAPGVDDQGVPIETYEAAESLAQLGICLD